MTSLPRLPLPPLLQTVIGKFIGFGAGVVAVAVGLKSIDGLLYSFDET